MKRSSKPAAMLAAAALASSAAAATAHAAPPNLVRVATINAGTAATVATAREPNGSLALVYQTLDGPALRGLAAISISPSGKVSPQVQALPTWQAGRPALTASSNGDLHAIFGAISPNNVDSVWEIVSHDGGATWSAPADVKGGGPNEAGAYAADASAVNAPFGSVLALPWAGTLFVQTGLGAGSPSVAVTDANDGAVGDVALGVDASAGSVVAGWQSIAHDVQDYLQQVGPTMGALQAVPGPPHNTIQVAGRDTGPGVFAPYSPDGKHVRLLRYGGGSVAVGSLPTTTAKALGVATGPDGRMWVMWGDDAGGGIALTRSNKAVTEFEPVQHVGAKIASLWRIFGDGRLGPLDLLVDELPDVQGTVPPVGLYHAHVLPVLSAGVSVVPLKNKKLVVVGHKVTVTVSDAGDPVAGATVKVGTKTATTNAQGKATISLFGVANTGLTVTSPGYQSLSQALNL